MELKIAETTVNIGAINQGQEGIPVEWVIEQGREEIVGLKPGCGCTADVEIVDNKIVATYNDNTSDSAFKKGNTLNISKSVHLFLNDGEPLKVKNDRGVMVYNNNKSRKTLTFTAQVKKV